VPTRAQLPGLGLAGIVVAIAFALEKLVKVHTPIVLSPLVAAVLIGALLTNLRVLPELARPGLQYAARRLLRIGIVILGLQLSLTKLRDLGLKGVALVLVTTTVTFFGTQWLGKRLGLSPGLRLLVATGFSICGASAVAAMRPVSGADDDDTVYAIGLVTICGSLAIALLPSVGHALGFSDVRFGTWVGASVHDVAQTVATAASRTSDAAREAAIVVKLTRVVMLAPLVAGVSVWRRRQTAVASATSLPADGTATAKLPPIVPAFVAGFLAMVVLNSAVKLPADFLHQAKNVERILLAAALVGLGAGVDVRKLRAIGPRPLLLGLASWVLIATMTAVGVVILGIG
jgi:uncharacterized integral membrane protein (TIGR00698 family)